MQLLELGRQLGVPRGSSERLGRLKQQLVDVELRLVLERQVRAEVERAPLELLVRVGFAELDELLDEVVEVLVEGVEVEDLVVVFLKVVVVRLEELVQLFRQGLVAALELQQAAHGGAQLLLEALGLQRVVHEGGVAQRGVALVLDQVAGEPLQVLVLVLPVDLALDVGALLQQCARRFGARAAQRDAFLTHDEGLPAALELLHALVFSEFGGTQEHVAQQQGLVGLVEGDVGPAQEESALDAVQLARVGLHAGRCP